MNKSQTRDEVAVPQTGTPKQILLLGMPAFLAAAIEFLGFALTDKELRPLYPGNPVLVLIGVVGLGLSIVAPFFAGIAFVTAVKKARSWVGFLLLVFGLSALLLSLFGCAWTLSGHPTWMQGYTP